MIKTIYLIFLFLFSTVCYYGENTLNDSLIIILISFFIGNLIVNIDKRITVTSPQFIFGNSIFIYSISHPIYSLYFDLYKELPISKALLVHFLGWLTFTLCCGVRKKDNQIKECKRKIFSTHKN